MQMSTYLGRKGVPVALAVPFDARGSYATSSNVGRLLNLTHVGLPSVAKMKEDGQKVVKIISGDKAAKSQVYCDIVKLSNQIEETEPNSKKANELNKRMDELSAKSGPEYLALVGELQGHGSGLRGR